MKPPARPSGAAPAHSLADIRAGLFSAVLSDSLDRCGVTKQALPSRIRPLDLASVMVGRARTAAFMEVYHVAEGVNPYELEIALIDSLQPGETMRFVNDHDPLPLLDQLRSRYGNSVAIEYRQKEPGAIVIDFVVHPAAGA